jgi:hypothetical protein
VHGPIPGAVGTDQWPIQAVNNSHMSFTEINFYPKINRYMKMEIKITFVIFILNLYCFKTEKALPPTDSNHRYRSH